MRMIKITKGNGKDQCLINPSQITNIHKCFEGTVWIVLSCSANVSTQFTTIDHALDYIQRASSHSLVGG